MMSIVDNNNLVIQDEMRPSSANEQDLPLLEDLAWTDPMGDSDLARGHHTLSNIDGLLKAAPFADEDLNQDPLLMPPMTTEDITEFLMELENMEEPSENKNNDTLESLVSSVSRDMFEPIPILDFRNHHHSMVTNRYLDGQETFSKLSSTVRSAENYQLTVPQTVVVASHDVDHAVLASNCPAGEEDASSSSASSSDDERSYCPKFRGYQCDQWMKRFEELREFFEKNGHSSVPHTDLSNKRLARWVKRQRYQYKLRQDGKPSAMTDERIKTLEQLQFTWDSHGAAFEDRLKELEDFKARHKHCNVPSNYRANSSLASWVKCQRRQYRLHREGKHSNITQARIVQLEQMGFQFNFRVGHHHRSCHQRNSGGWS
jgi:hypothetical protein